MTEAQFLELKLKGQVKLQARQDVLCLECKESDLVPFNSIGGELYYCINIQCSRFKSAIYKRVGDVLFAVRGYPDLRPEFFCVNCKTFSYKNQRYRDECVFFDEGPDVPNHAVCLFLKK